MSRLKGRLKKLERKDGPVKRISAIIHTIVGVGENGPVETGEAVASIPGLDAPKVIKSINETREEFSARVGKLSKQAQDLDEMSDDALEAAIAALNEIIVEANKQAELDNADYCYTPWVRPE